MKNLKIRLECLESVDSTNNYAKKLAKNGAPEGLLVIANTQTAGRGRMGRSFASPQGLGIYMSLLLRPGCRADCVQSLTAFTAVAVCRALEKHEGISPEIKWVNDVLLNGKKICGILCESSVSENGVDYAVIGIGLNVITRREDFPPEISDIAGSVYTESGKIIERGKLITDIVSELCTMYSAWCEDKSAYLDEYKARCKMLGGFVTVSGAEGEREAIADDIMPDFGLRVRYPDGFYDVLYSGEVSLR